MSSADRSYDFADDRRFEKWMPVEGVDGPEYQASVEWRGLGRRIASPIEALASARGFEPVLERSAAAGSDRFYLSALTFDVIADRAGSFFQEHSDLPDAAKLGLCQRFPFNSGSFPFGAEEKLVVSERAQTRRESGAQDDNAFNLEFPAICHSEVSAACCATPTRERPTDSGNGIGARIAPERIGLNSHDPIGP
ncbi:MAG: hypothetical protein ACYDD1_17465 [Caulobacteraceae bacterium]